jgi:hypothetical protein
MLGGGKRKEERKMMERYRLIAAMEAANGEKGLGRAGLYLAPEEREAYVAGYAEVAGYVAEAALAAAKVAEARRPPAPVASGS